MKKQIFNKKLVLKKGIISNLNMSNVKGGRPAEPSQIYKTECWMCKDVKQDIKQNLIKSTPLEALQKMFMGVLFLE